MASQICFTLPPELSSDFQAYCKKNNLSQSEFIRHLIRVEIYHEKSLSKGGEKNESRRNN